MHEKELIAKSLEGDEEAFKALVLQNKDSVHRHVLNLVHDEEIAADLTQETFLHAFQHLASFKQKAKFSTWLWRISHNLSLNYLKRERRFDQEFNENLLTPKPEKVIDDELLSKIQQILPHLPEKQRIVFEMYDLQRIPQKEIAATLGISHGTVRSRLHYARRKIREWLAVLKNL